VQPASPTQAILLDSLGTLVELEPPAPRLREELRQRGFEVSEERAAAAFAAEIAYYVEHHLEGRDASSLAELRDRCAAVIAESLAIPELAPADARDALVASIRFRPFPDVAPALAELRGLGLRLVVVSNWDCSLREVLDGAGLLPLVDDVVTSAEAGAAKPDPAPFRAGLEAAAVSAAEAVHVGDSPENDVAGAAAAGIRALLLDRGGERGDIASLAELPAVL
jgi:putative hydrolase of the HAD superfamily